MKNKISVYIAAVILIFGVCFAVAPAFGKKYIPTHDGEYHIIRIVEFSKMLSQGNLFPRWAPTLNSGYGIPIFEFHYPFPNYLGAGIRTLTHDAVYAFQVSLGLGYVASMFGMFLWLLALFGVFPALIGATVGACVPYWFVDMYVRGSVGEMWATAFLFFVLYSIEKKKTVCIAVFYALLILSHNILAMIYTPFLLGYLAVRNWHALWGMFAGLGLSSFFWLPALMEKQYVAGLNTVNFREHFARFYELIIPSWGTEFSSTGSLGNRISFQIGVIPLIGICAALFSYIRKRKSDALFLYMGCVLGIAVVCMLPWSRFLWEVIPLIQLIQYPWRFLSFVIPVAGFCIGYWVKEGKLWWWAIILMLCAFFFSRSYMRPVLYEPRNEAYYLARPNFTDGTSSMGNSFSTIWTGWREKRPETPIVIQNGTLTEIKTDRYMEKLFLIAMDAEGDVMVNTLYFPGWTARVDNQNVPIQYEIDGIIHVTVPQGNHSLTIEFLDTLPRTTGNLLSIVSLVGIVGWGILKARRS